MHDLCKYSYISLISISIIYMNIDSLFTLGRYCICPELLVTKAPYISDENDQAFLKVFNPYIIYTD